MSPDHPDPDDLADLAADVLDPGTAHTVREHVTGCAACAGLLDDAVRIRDLLRAEDPGPMPEEVWARIDLALHQASIDGTGSVAVVTPPERGSSAPAATVTPAERTKLRRPIRSPQATRRQRKDDETTRWGAARASLGWGGLAAVAAGVIAVLAVGGTLISGFLPENGSITAVLMPDSGDASDAGGAEVTSRSVIVATDTDYRPATIETQVRALVAEVGGTAAAYAPDGDAGGVSGQSEDTHSLGTGAADLPAGVWSAKELEACLTALDAADLSPIAVDFARFEGREVAMLVLPSPDGSYEVWAVSRTCRPNADGTQFFRIVKP